MEPEGMVHALEQIKRMLKPEGGLVDIHPFQEGHFIEAYQDGNLLFSERVRENDSEYVQHAEKAISQVVDRGVFAVEGSAEFEFMTYSTSVEELREYWHSLDVFDDPRDEAITVRENDLFAQVDAILRASGAGSKAAIKERVRMTLLKPRWQNLDP